MSIRKRAPYREARPRVNKDVYRMFAALTTMLGGTPGFVLNYLMAKWIKAIQESTEYEIWVQQVGEDVRGYPEFWESSRDAIDIGAEFARDLAPVIEGLLDPWKENHGQE